MDKKSEKEWEEEESFARLGCAKVWPKIVVLRAELKTYEDTHGYYEARLIEAQRHLIKLPPKETEQQLDKKIDVMHRAIKNMTEDAREELLNILERGGD